MAKYFFSTPYGHFFLPVSFFLRIFAAKPKRLLECRILAISWFHLRKEV